MLLRPLLLYLAAVSAWQPQPRSARLAPARAAFGDESLDGPFVVLRVQFDASVSEARVRDDIIGSFPFAAVLPVQPLKTEPTETGLRLLFRRKPTATKSSIDGGLDFRVDAPSAGAGPILFVTRITDGATWTKLISEKLVSARARARARCVSCVRPPRHSGSYARRSSPTSSEPPKTAITASPRSFTSTWQTRNSARAPWKYIGAGRRNRNPPPRRLPREHTRPRL